MLHFDSLLPQPVDYPVMLVRAEPRGEREVGTDPDKDGAKVPILNVEVVLVHSPQLGFQVSALTRKAHRSHDTRGLARFDDAHNLVRLF